MVSSPLVRIGTLEKRAGRGSPLVVRTHHFEEILEHSVERVLLTRPDGTILRANRAACRALERRNQALELLARCDQALPAPSRSGAAR